MKTRRAFEWSRIFSDGPAVIIPAGTPVEKCGSAFYVKPAHFTDEKLKDEAATYGCCVQTDNVEG